VDEFSFVVGEILTPAAGGVSEYGVRAGSSCYSQYRRHVAGRGAGRGFLAMSKKCGLKKTLCPGPITGGRPLFRGDCKFHENIDTIVVGPASMIARAVQKAVEATQERQREIIRETHREQSTRDTDTNPVTSGRREKDRRS
jgi:hypothetical protein